MESSEGKTDYTFRQAMRDYRPFRRGMLVLPHLEASLAVELEHLSQIHIPLSRCPLESRYLLNSLRTIRQEIRKTHRSLSALRRGLESLNLSDSEVERRIVENVKDSPHVQDILLRIKSAGGLSCLLMRVADFLRPRYDHYLDCIKLAKKYIPPANEYTQTTKADVTLSELALRVADCTPSTPDRMYAVCAVPPLVCIIAAVVGFLVLVGFNGDDEEDEELGDFPEPDPDADTPA